MENFPKYPSTTSSISKSKIRSSIKERYELDLGAKVNSTEESKASVIVEPKSNSSSEEETKMVESGQGKFYWSSSTSSDNAPLCQRCSSEDASLVCIVWGNCQLCPSCDDLIHSIGIFETHKRISIDDFEPDQTLKINQEPKNINGEIEIPFNMLSQPLTQEARDIVDKLKTKQSYLKSKLDEWDLILKSFDTKQAEIDSNFGISEDNLTAWMNALRVMIDNKENQLKEELELMKRSKLNSLSNEKSKIESIRQRIEDVNQIVSEGINNPTSIIESEQKNIDKRIEGCESLISNELSNKNEFNSGLPKMWDLDPLEHLFGAVSFESTRNSRYEENKYDSSLNDTNETPRDEESSKAEEIKLEHRPAELKKAGSLSILQYDKYKPREVKTSASNYITPSNRPDQTSRSRKGLKKSETRPIKRTMSSYGTSKEHQDVEKGTVRISSTSSSRQKYNNANKINNSFKELGSHSNRYTPQSKERREENVHSFIVLDKSPSLIKNSDNDKNWNNSVSGDNAPVQIDEEEEKRLIEEDPMRKRVFLNIAKTSTSVQVSWSHSNKNKTGKRIQYILEYGVGIKMNGEEQFRQIYKGKAHKWIITDLMPRTSYRFKVVPFKTDDDGTEILGEWSDIRLINTYDNQDIHPNTLGHHASVLMKKQEKWINFEKQGLITAQYGYSYGVQMWKITIEWHTIINSMPNYSHYNEDFSGLMHVGVINSKARSNKIFGSVVPYSLQKGKIKIKVLLETEKLRVTIFTSASSRKGDIINDLPKGKKAEI